MTDRQLIEIFYRHHTQEHEYDFQEILSAMREAMRLAIEEFTDNPTIPDDYKINKYILEEHLRIKEAVEKGSIDFKKWCDDNEWIPVYTYGRFMGYNKFMQPLKENKTIENLYKLYLQDQNKKLVL